MENEADRVRGCRAPRPGTGGAWGPTEASRRSQGKIREFRTPESMIFHGRVAAIRGGSAASSKTSGSSTSSGYSTVMDDAGTQNVESFFAPVQELGQGRAPQHKHKYPAWAPRQYVGWRSPGGKGGLSSGRSSGGEEGSASRFVTFPRSRAKCRSVSTRGMLLLLCPAAPCAASRSLFLRMSDGMSACYRPCLTGSFSIIVLKTSGIRHCRGEAEKV